MPRRIEVLRFGVFELDLDARELRRQGRRVHLQDKPYELLVALAERPGQSVTREELHQRLWATDTYVEFDDGLNTAAAKLRDALGDSAKSPRFIETIPRQGYRWIAPIEPSGHDRASADASVAEPPADSIAAGRPAVVPVSRWPWSIALAAICGLVLVAAVLSRKGDSPGVLGQFEIDAPASVVFGNDGMAPNAALSPDGRNLLFVARHLDDRQDRIWIRPLSSVEARPLRGTDGAWAPFWSPDCRRIGFFADRKLKIADLETGTVVPLADAPAAISGSWSSRDEIAFGPSPAGALVRIAARGGIATPATSLNKANGERRHVWPQFLPDGRHLLYLAQHDAVAQTTIVVRSLDTAETTEVVKTPVLAAFAAPGHLLFVRDGVLFAQAFNVEAARLAGQPTALASGVGMNLVTGRAFFSVSGTGTLAFSGSRRLPLFQLEWFDEGGRRFGKLGPPVSARHIALSPDERHVAIEAEDPVTRDPDLWVLDAARGTLSRIVADPVQEEGTIWAPDGRSLIYARHRANQAPADLHTATMSGETSRVLSAGDVSVHPTDWSAAGNVVLYELETTSGAADIWALPMDADFRPFSVTTGRADEREGHLSPAGRLLAYTSDETGQRAVYIRPFDRHTAHAPILIAPGSAPRWRADGRALFFTTTDQAIAVVTVSTAPDLKVDPPHKLFELAGLVSHQQAVQYSVAKNGRRFLVATVIREPRGASINVVTNWTAALSSAHGTPLFSSLLAN